MKVLIASSSFDRATTMPVAEHLERNGSGVVLYEADEVFKGNRELTCWVAAAGLSMHYDGQDISRQSIDAAWYRRPSLITAETEDKAKQLKITDEVKQLQAALWQLVPDDRWLNAPERIKAAENKLGQLALAQTVGFSVPQTLVSNMWERILRSGFLPQLIMKMPKGILYENDDIKAMYTTILNEEQIVELLDTLPFPGIFQPYLQKEREWRITVVGENVFGATITTTEDAKDDWRKHQQTKDVTFSKAIVSDEVQELCARLLGALGLRFGAFDLVEDQDGKVTFLEMNPNGQFMWLEETLGLPISNAIASELIKLAKARA